MIKCVLDSFLLGNFDLNLKPNECMYCAVMAARNLVKSGKKLHWRPLLGIQGVALERGVTSARGSPLLNTLRNNITHHLDFLQNCKKAKWKMRFNYLRSNFVFIN